MLSADHVWVVSSGGCVQSSGSLPFRVMNNDVLEAIVKNPARLLHFSLIDWQAVVLSLKVLSL